MINELQELDYIPGLKSGDRYSHDMYIKTNESRYEGGYRRVVARDQAIRKSHGADHINERYWLVEDLSQGIEDIRRYVRKMQRVKKSPLNTNTERFMSKRAKWVSPNANDFFQELGRINIVMQGNNLRSDR